MADLAIVCDSCLPDDADVFTIGITPPWGRCHRCGTLLEKHPNPVDPACLSRYKVVCDKCKPEHKGQSGRSIEQWELSDFKLGFECAVCGEQFGPVLDFITSTSYRLQTE